MKINKIKMTSIIFVLILIFTSCASAIKNSDGEISQDDDDLPNNQNIDDFDPLVDLEVTVTIKEIRALDRIDIIGDPDFYVKVFINDVEHISPTWRDQKYLTPNWSATEDVPDDVEEVNIKIQLWESNFGLDKLCDLGNNEEPNMYDDMDMVYDIKTGHWRGDDYCYPFTTNFDISGYGRLNGCDDNSIYERDRDCELWFDITMNDYDGDGIPYWTEVNIYETNPEENDLGRDDDNDGVPIEWEYKWGHYFQYDWHDDKWESIWIYDPFESEDHANIDLDIDGLDNVEEYLTSQWGSDPFRQDIFVELDQMDEGPNGEKSVLHEGSKLMMQDSFDRQNKVLHIDDGKWEDSGFDWIPFDDSTNDYELWNIYNTYFLHGDENNWRASVFHHGLVIYNSERFRGFAYGSNRFQISSKGVDLKIVFFGSRWNPTIVYGSVYMHELGHTLGIFHSNTDGCDNRQSVFPRSEWLKYRGYYSCMNYWYTYRCVDYSDGSRGKNDFDDWERIDLAYFQQDTFV